MPMFFPDLKSIQECVRAMRMNKGEKRYNGIYPETEEELPEARKQLGKYMRVVWNDIIAALEIENAVSEKNYDQKLSEAIEKEMGLRK